MSHSQSSSFYLWINKLFECFIVYIFLRDLAYSYLPLDPYIFDSVALYFGTLFTGWNLLLAIITIAFTVWWQREENKQRISSQTLHEWLRAIMCYYSSFLILQYGLQKIYNNQFHHNFYRDDTLARDLTGFSVAWNFFSYSSFYTIIVGILQVAGGVLLLFKRTRLMAAVILLPVMINIFFINQFYGVSADAYVNCLFILTTSVYLLWLQREKILAIIFNKNTFLSSKKMIYIKAVLRIAILVFAFMANYPYRQEREGEYYIGKWKVTQLIKNGSPVDLQRWQSDSSAWNNVYVETNGKIAFSANPFYYDYSNHRTINYHFEPGNGGLTLIKHRGNARPEFIKINIKHYTADSMQWDMTLQENRLQMRLVKDSSKKIIEDKDLR